MRGVTLRARRACATGSEEERRGGEEEEAEGRRSREAKREGEKRELNYAQTM